MNHQHNWHFLREIEVKPKGAFHYYRWGDLFYCMMCLEQKQLEDKEASSILNQVKDRIK